MSEKLFEEFNSKQKVRVRKTLWDRAFEDLLFDRKIAEATKLRYLCMPGYQCIYLKDLVEHEWIAKRNVTAVELDPQLCTPIHIFLEGQGMVLDDKIERLFGRDDEDLLSAFPFDVVNLDFCGQGFVWPDVVGDGESVEENFGFPDLHHPKKRDKEHREHMERWNAIAKCIEENKKEKKRRWYLLLTLSCTRNNKGGTNFLVDRHNDLMKMIGVSDKRSVASWGSKHHQLVHETVPYVIAAEAIHRGYRPDPEHFLSCRYTQDEKQTPMASWRFCFDLMPQKDLGTKHKKAAEELEKFCEGYYTEDKLKEF